METYTLYLADEGCSTIREIVASTEKEALARVEQVCADWVRDGEWGDDGASVRVIWILLDAHGDEIDSGSETVEVEPDHDALIRAAGGDQYCAHRWTGEGHGGCGEHPGVFGTGGTSLLIVEHCERCGLVRRQELTGPQRNPGEHDRVVYEMPEDAS